jgi:hypothetical protein
VTRWVRATKARRERYDNISNTTWFRWLDDPRLGFKDALVKIRGIQYLDADKLDAIDAKLCAEASDKAA